MDILVIGSGGREHALVWKIAQSPKVNKIYCAPGNAGIAEIATCVPINADNIDGLLEFALKNNIALTVVGPENSLSLGIVNYFEAKGLKIFGPTIRAAKLEASKSFAKELMLKYNIPTAAGKSFENYENAKQYLSEIDFPIVIKADGLAAGKGVIICESNKKAEKTLLDIMEKKIFGEAGNKVLIEEFLDGEEASFIAFSDGKTVLPLPSSQDHKKIFNDDKGPNTGGMGAYSPAPIVDGYFHKKIMAEVMIPTVKAMASEERQYKGVLYAGLMIKDNKIKVLEYNCRFGDPETQPLLMRLKSDIVPIFEATIDNKLDECKIEIDKRPSVCVVMASKGYPESYPKGDKIIGIKNSQDVFVFHAGTKLSENKEILTNGGRVLGVTALGNNIENAISNAYEAVSKISWENDFYRNDIGKKAMVRLKAVPEVGIVMGSDSDLKVMEETVDVLKSFGIFSEVTVASAHRTPEKAATYAKTARKKGLKVIIAGAGHAAHLAGALAAQTTLPIIGVPIDSSAFQGFDALLSTVQMPPGIPVATVAVGKPGARNAGILAAQMIALTNKDLEKKLEDFKKDMAKKVEAKAKKLADWR